MEKTFVGNFIFGVWVCPKCKKTYHPIELQNKKNPFKCPYCKLNLVYKERET